LERKGEEGGEWEARKGNHAGKTGESVGRGFRKRECKNMASLNNTEKKGERVHTKTRDGNASGEKSHKTVQNAKHGEKAAN